MQARLRILFPERNLERKDVKVRFKTSCCEKTVLLPPTRWSATHFCKNGLRKSVLFMESDVEKATITLRENERARQ